jgi:quercetin dioxygenase-like cupin family protein
MLATGIIALMLAPAWGEDAISLKPVVTPVLDSGQTIIGQPIAYPAGTPEVTVSVITIAPGGETGWHLHAVPLIGYILDGVLTVDYGDKGTHTYKTGDGLLEAMNWPHNGMNKGTVPVRILAVYAGVTGIANAQAVAHQD